MKTIKELSRGELENAFRTQCKSSDFKEPEFECACCGDTDKAKFYYICDGCNERLYQESTEPNIL